MSLTYYVTTLSLDGQLSFRWLTTCKIVTVDLRQGNLWQGPSV
jgi:hypothetical protein